MLAQSSKIVRNSWQVLEKHIWMNSGLIKMQFFIMLLYFHRKNEINKIASQVSFKLFVKLFWWQLFCRTSFKAVFRTQSKIPSSQSIGLVGLVWNQWNGYYRMGTSIMKELRSFCLWNWRLFFLFWAKAYLFFVF